MEVRLAKKLGFCFGVERAIALAEQSLAERTGNIASLGEIIHNRQVVQMLSEQGLRVVDDPAKAAGTVLIRSHGEGPEVFETLSRRGVEIVDATCVLVKRAQQVVAQLAKEGYQVVVIGQAEHPEVKAVCAYAPGVVCVDTVEDLARLPSGAKLGIVCQTTHSPGHFGRMVGQIVARGHPEVKIVNTLCNEVRNRQGAAVELADQVDVMFVLGGKQSANTRQLAQLCAAEGVPTHHLERWAQFRPEMAAGKSVAGVTAGASTPQWVIEEFVSKLRAFDPAE
ncbi:hypothetical protein LCGC14_2548370 [marine sediment metagenome]|uniref:4-hydroxy-3-methylbut-2-enyl diphosphate reductase n=1 Tax=marine sediment metagenome TaxID=412755 RepID=A0A0F9BBF7_9ZZZZ